MMSPNVSEDRLHRYQLSSENIGNQLQSGNSMMSPNVSEDRLHMYQLSSENIENQLQRADFQYFHCLVDTCVIGLQKCLVTPNYFHSVPDFQYLHCLADICVIGLQKHVVTPTEWK
jgi:hypothetical protein